MPIGACNQQVRTDVFEGPFDLLLGTLLRGSPCAARLTLPARVVPNELAGRGGGPNQVGAMQMASLG